MTDTTTPITEEERERLSDASWEGHRNRQLRKLGIDPEDLD